MIGKKQNLEPKLFYHGVSLERRISKDHPLRKINKLIDFDFVRNRVASLYGNCGNPSVDPVVILKLMFLLFYENVKSERALMAQLPLRLDWLWFCGYDLDQQTPNHSVLSKARHRWGLEIFSEFFQNILQQCIDAGLVDGEVIHVDSSMIDANASKDKLQVQLRMTSNDLYDKLEQSEPAKLNKRVNPVDEDARLGRKYGKTTLGYKDHRTVDDKKGIITSTTITPANVNDEKQFINTVEKHQENTNRKVKTAVADKAYGIGENYKYMHDNNITPCISHKVYKKTQHNDFLSSKFTYDKTHDCYICPAGFKLKYRQSKPSDNCKIYHIDRQTCEQCPYFDKCVSSTKRGRQVQRSNYAQYYEWSDNCLGKHERRDLMSRRKAKVEGSFADAANNHGFKRARWRGIVKVQIQNLIIAATQNLRKLMRAINSSRPAVASLSYKFCDLNLVIEQILLCIFGKSQI